MLHVVVVALVVIVKSCGIVFLPAYFSFLFFLSSCFSLSHSGSSLVVRMPHVCSPCLLFFVVFCTFSAATVQCIRIVYDVCRFNKICIHNDIKIATRKLINFHIRMFGAQTMTNASGCFLLFLEIYDRFCVISIIHPLNIRIFGKTEVIIGGENAFLGFLDWSCEESHDRKCFLPLNILSLQP